jgi:hypothetical protein
VKERLTRVTSEAQLKPGLLVQWMVCHSCPRVHRSLLLGLGDLVLCGVCSAGHALWHHAGNGHKPTLCARASIAWGELFIVDPFAEDSSSTTQKVKRPREVARGR